jgi:uncharacterized membrane protein YkoI
MRRVLLGAVMALSLVVLTAVGVKFAVGQAEKVEADKLPKAVLDVFKARFPGAKFSSITKETEGGKVIYDLEFTHNDRKIEMDLYEDGKIINIERAIATKDLPAAALKAVEAKYPKATIKEVMEIKEVKDKDEVLEGYEVVLESADKKAVELMVTAEGKVLEEEVDGKKILEKK